MGTPDGASRSDAQVTTWTFTWHLQWGEGEGVSYRTEPSPSRVCCSCLVGSQVSNVRIELRSQTCSWCLRFACWRCWKKTGQSGFTFAKSHHQTTI